MTVAAIQPIADPAATATTLASMRQGTQLAQQNTAIGFFNSQSFDLMQRVARMLASSSLVPAPFRLYDERKKTENPSAISNCMLALNMSTRLNADVLMICQNLHIIEGRPSWSSQWIIAAVNECGRFSPLRYDIRDLGQKTVEYETTKWVDGNRIQNRNTAVIHDCECVAWATEKATGDRIEGPAVSINLSVMEGWYGKNGSKWQTMPQMMLRYRAASYFGRLYAPEVLMGLQSVEEMQDVVDVQPDGTASVTTEPARRRMRDVVRAEPPTTTTATLPIASAEIFAPSVAPAFSGDDSASIVGTTVPAADDPAAERSSPESTPEPPVRTRRTRAAASSME